MTRTIAIALLAASFTSGAIAGDRAPRAGASLGVSEATAPATAARLPRAGGLVTVIAEDATAPRRPRAGGVTVAVPCVVDLDAIPSAPSCGNLFPTKLAATSLTVIE